MSGGANNEADGGTASVSGGENNLAADPVSSISGGCDNLTGTGTAPSADCYPTGLESVAGGYEDVASGFLAAVSGGDANSASGIEASIGGGRTNTASGEGAFIGGGEYNLAADTYGSIFGGCDNLVGPSSVGTATCVDPGDEAVVGGHQNYATGNLASVVGGFLNDGSNLEDLVLGGRGGSAGNDQVQVGGSTQGVNVSNGCVHIAGAAGTQC